MPPKDVTPKSLKIAWIADPKKFGNKPGYPKPSLRDRLRHEAGWSFVRVTSKEICAGALRRGGYDLLVVPGGYAPNFAEALGEHGGRCIREFVSEGGGYLGICAGAYLGSMWGFELLPVDILDIDHWARGKTEDCRLCSTAAGVRVAGSVLPDVFSVRYANGPLFGILDDCVEPLLLFESDLRGQRGTYPALMRGSPACVAGPLGRGRVVLLSPHMEGSPAVADAFRSFVAWAAGGRTAIADLPPDVPQAVPQCVELGAAAGVASDVAGEVAEFTDIENGTDGEDTDMDVPSLVRLRSLVQFEQVLDELDFEASEAGDLDLPPPPPPPPRLVLARSCSDGCSGQLREVSPADLEASALKIQRAARTRVAPTGASERPARVASKSSSAAAGATVAKTAARRASSKPRASIDGPLLRRGGADYVCWLGGPILLTAPHSMKIMRGGGETGERMRAHKRERWTAEMALVLARQLHTRGVPASVMFWNRIAGPGSGRKDPNYLLPSQYPTSSWHCALHRWALGSGGLPIRAGGGARSTPLLHIDLHGKVSEKLHLDLGAAPLEEVWPRADMPFVAALKSRFRALLDQAMEECGVVSLKGKQIEVDVDPALHGFWGENTVTTISHQTVQLGIPAVQFEMPPRLRERLVLDPALGTAFASAILDIYHNLVTPWWFERAQCSTPWPMVRQLQPALAGSVEEHSLEYGGFDEWAGKLLNELLEIERSTSEVQI